MDRVCILIPAYKPDVLLIDLVDALIDLGFPKNDIFVVRDGGGSEYDDVFSEIKSRGCALVIHEANLGKGAALKSGLRAIAKSKTKYIGVVTADADGQHHPEDILKVASNMHNNPNSIILGVRTFDGDVPFRSRFGNKVTRWLFFLLTGKFVSDTQTGLRGIPAKLFKTAMLMRGSGYEFEINFLMRAARNFQISLMELPIRTIYLDSNARSHFRPVLDSIKIYLLIFRYGLSSLSSFGFDYALFVITLSLFDSLAFASYFSRSLSLVFNYFMNREFVFDSKTKVFRTFVPYLLLSLFSISLSYGVLSLYVRFYSSDVLVAKIFTEFFLFFFNFYFQRRFIFRGD